MNHTLKTSSNNIIEALKIPLSGYGSNNRGKNTFLWSSHYTSNGIYAMSFSYNKDTLTYSYYNNDYEFSVRCIKD
jgi:uncharacterized protein (TIGR02145 family)